MNHLRFSLAFLLVLACYGLSFGQEQQPHSPTAREWTGLIPGYQEPAGVEAQYGVMTEVRAPRNRPSDAQLVTQAPIPRSGGKALPSSGSAYKSPATSPANDPSKQAARKPPALDQTEAKPVAGEKLVSRDEPRSFDKYGAQLLTTLLPKPEPRDLILHCGVQGRPADVVSGRCM